MNKLQTKLSDASDFPSALRGHRTYHVSRNCGTNIFTTTRMKFHKERFVRDGKSLSLNVQYM